MLSHFAVPTLKPFRALRYAPNRVDLAGVLGDPDDDPRHVRQLQGAPARRALLLSEWRRAGVVTMDDLPCITVVRRVGSDHSSALGFFAWAQDDAPLNDASTRTTPTPVEQRARVQVEPQLLEVVEDSGRLRRTLESAADREPDASFALLGDTVEAYVVDDVSTAARLAALSLSPAVPASGGLLFIVEKKDAWTRVPTGLCMAPLPVAAVGAAP